MSRSPTVMAREGRQQGTTASGILVIVVLAASAVGIAAGRQLQDSTDESPFCGLRNCQKVLGGPWCNAKPTQCATCGGKWCTAETPVPTSTPIVSSVPTPPGKPFCGNRNCEKAVSTGPWCSAEPANCAKCGGQWCNADETTPTPTPNPTPTPVTTSAPVPEERPFCGSRDCQTAMKAPGWCSAKPARCAACGGHWCNPNPSSPTPVPPPATPSTVCSDARDIDTCKALSGCDWGKRPDDKGSVNKATCNKKEAHLGPSPGAKLPTGGLSPPSSQCRRKSAPTRNVISKRAPGALEIQTRSFVTLQTPTESSVDDILAETRIVGGTQAPKGRYSYMVNIASKGGFIFCGGSLISPSTVLCAAHCAGGIDKVYIGRHDLKDGSEVYEEIEVDSTILHPDYRDPTAENDIMVITLKQESSYLPVVLDSPGSSDGVDLDSEGRRLNVMGWGTIEEDGASSPVLLEAVVNYIPNRICNSVAYNGLVFDDMICAGAPGKDSCQGDSGGPLIVKANNAEEDVQVGVVSWGFGCADQRFPGVYSRVTTAYGWIKEQVENAGESLAELCRDDTP